MIPVLRKAIFISVFFFLAAASLSAQHASQIPEYALAGAGDAGAENQKDLVEISLDSGILMGTLFEYVFYDNTGSGSFDYVLSRLDWNIQPLAYSGITVKTRVFENVFGGIGAWFGFPLEVGFMEDRDWNYGTPYSGDLNMYSRHRNILYYSIFADMNMGYGVVNDENLVLSLLVGFSYKRFHFSGQDGYNDYNLMTVPSNGTFTGEVITYEQNWFIPYIGAEMLWRLSPDFYIKAFLCISPFTAFVYARDLHLLTDTEYLDFPAWAFYTAGKVSFFYRFWGKFAAHMEILMQWSPPSKGKDYYGSIDTDFYSYDPSVRGGAGMFTYGVSLKLTYLF